ncbi:hypothetical protein BC1002_2983 [Paraburkholderia atlantica]|uniref:DUF2171 domain-containing protein n=1 Tax=Paraburkholderia atlantica TaxID=2654982 RepID=D5W6A9_PARAM|nr:hypothetical protein [Paraburkholderia atlantica]ADG17030.1 hypothetical protein BC1002_2983 [Paraburkholderia atlantica]
MPKKEAKDLQVGDVQLHAGMVRQTIVSVTPIGRTGGYVEITSHQLGKPDNVEVATVPAHMLVEVIED